MCAGMVGIYILPPNLGLGISPPIGELWNVGPAYRGPPLPPTEAGATSPGWVWPVKGAMALTGVRWTAAGAAEAGAGGAGVW